MRLEHSPKNTRAMTLMEVVCVLFIVVILAGLLYPSDVHFRRRSATIVKAKVEIQGLVAAINQYDTIYSKLPGAPISSLTNQPSDFTYGTWRTSAAANGITNASGPQANNSEIMAVLLDLTNFANGKATLNADHSRNPQQISFLNVKQVNDTNSSGLGLDGVFRDPWGNPYIITLDYNSDGKCRDAFYRLASVSENGSSQPGFNGLVRPTPPPYNSAAPRDSFEASGQVMVWSLGPDGKADAGKKANEGVNRDNILSW